MTLFTVKFAPKNTAQIFGQQLGVSQLKDFIVNYKQKANKAAIIVGPIGAGKTSSVYALAKEMGYEMLEINSSDIRNEENLSTFLGAALGQQSLFFKPKIVLIDEIDNISGVQDRGCLPALLKAIEKSAFPVIMTANDLQDNKFKALKKACLNIEYHALQYRTVAHCLQWVCEQEKISFDEKGINTLARQSAGDLRAALLDLQVCSRQGTLSFTDVTNLSQRKRTESIINALMIIFKSSSIDNSLPVLENTDVDAEEVMLWLDNNLQKEYNTPAALARAYEHLARADVFLGRIKRWQHWRFLAYVNNLLTAGISSAKDEKNPQFIQYKPTLRFLQMWQAKMKFGKKEDIALKMAALTHSSKRLARQQIPFLQKIFQKGKGKEIAEELELTAEEIDWLKK